MQVLIIYDTYFSNTEQIARAIGEGIGSHADVTIRKVSDVTPEQLRGTNLLIVGSPTRAFRPSPAIKKFLKSIPRQGLTGVRVAAFDTGISLDDVNPRLLKLLMKLFGYAAKPIASKLVAKSGELAAPPEGFFVLDTKGPLKEGELERAREWGRRVVG
ncbi:flavodoxin family protein [Candidatus Latescibacterota bacterium]